MFLWSDEAMSTVHFLLHMIANRKDGEVVNLTLTLIVYNKMWCLKKHCHGERKSNNPNNNSSQIQMQMNQGLNTKLLGYKALIPY